MGNTQSKMYKIYIITIVLVSMLSIIPTIQSQTSVRVAATIWSPDGNRIAIAEQGTGGVVRVWDMSGATPVVQVAIPNVFAQYIHWKPDGKRILTGLKNGIQIWNVDPNDPLYTLGQLIATLNDPGATSSTWNYNGSKIITQSEYPIRNRIWSTINDQFSIINEYKGPYGGIVSNPVRDDALLLDTSAGVIANLANLDSILLKYNGDLSRGFLSGAWNSNGTKLIVSGEDGTFIFEPYVNPANPILRLDKTYHGLAWSPDNQRIAGIELKNNSVIVEVFRADNGLPLAQYPVSDLDYGLSLSWNLDGTKLAYPAPINGVTLPPIVTPPQPAAATSLLPTNTDTPPAAE